MTEKFIKRKTYIIDKNSMKEYLINFVHNAINHKTHFTPINCFLNSFGAQFLASLNNLLKLALLVKPHLKLISPTLNSVSNNHLEVN